MRCLDENQLADRWGITARTLQSWRATWDSDDGDKVGPPFVRIGKRRIVYCEDDVLAYEASQRIGQVSQPTWTSAVKRAAGTLNILARQARTDKARAMLEAIRDELRDLLPYQS